MQRLGYAVFSAFMLLIAALSPALADHMNGTFVGVGADAGTTIQVVQQGGDIAAQITGPTNGQLVGQQDGQNSFSGIIEMANGTRYQFGAQWSPQSLTITLFDNAGNVAVHNFVPGSLGGTGPGPEPEPEPAPADVEYYVTDGGQQFGPMTMQDVLDRIASGESNADTLVWTTANQQWIDIEQVTELAYALPAPQPEPVPEPEPAPTEEVEYYVTDGGQQVGPLTLQQVLDRIAAGESNRETTVWTTTNQEWVDIEAVAELVDALPAEQDVVTETQYWFLDNGAQTGPFTLQQALDRIAAGEANRQSQVYVSTGTEWVAIDTVAELAGALPAAQVANYYLYYVDGGQRGPFTLEQVVQGIQGNTVPRGTLAWQPGWAEWVKVETLAEFSPAFPPLVPRDVQYFVIVDGERFGPLSESEVVSRITELTSKGPDLAWKKGLEAWAPLSTFVEFADALAAVAPPPEPPTDLPLDPPVVEEDDGPPPVPDVVVTPEPPVEGGDTPEVTELSDEDFRAGLEQMINDQFESQLPENVRADAVACLVAAFAPLTAEEKQLVLSRQATDAEKAAMEEAHPGTKAAVKACGDAVLATLEPTPAPEPPAEPTTEPAAEYSDEAFAAGIEKMVGDGLPADATAEAKAAAVACVTEAMTVLTLEEKQALFATDMEPTQELGAAFDAAHPGFTESVDACGDGAREPSVEITTEEPVVEPTTETPAETTTTEQPPAVEPTPTTEQPADQPAETTTETPAETTTTETPPPPPVADAPAEEDPFSAAMKAYIETIAPPDTTVDLDALLACSLDAMSVLTAEEKQALIDVQMKLTPEMEEALETAHPGIGAASKACNPA